MLPLLLIPLWALATDPFLVHPVALASLPSAIQPMLKTAVRRQRQEVTTRQLRLGLIDRLAWQEMGSRRMNRQPIRCRHHCKGPRKGQYQEHTALVNIPYIIHVENMSFLILSIQQYMFNHIISDQYYTPNTNVIFC